LREAWPPSFNPGDKWSYILPGKEVATFGSGCFWCTEAVFSELNGVISVVPGYAGGKVPNPTYEEVCTDTTGHAEVARVTFDPTVISYRELLEVFFSTHDPTTLNRQGADVGTQYRSVIFYGDQEQKMLADAIIRELTADRTFKDTIVTEVVPMGAFYPAEDYHREYYKRNPSKPYCQVVIAPKLAKFRAHWKAKLKAPFQS